MAVDWRQSADPDLVRLVTEGYEAFDAQDWVRAGGLLAQAAPRMPEGADARATWFDAALSYKFARDWVSAFELGTRAVAGAERGKQEPAYWNLGIAATVLRRWEVARDAWLGYGIPIPDGDGEIVADFGVTCVRIDTGGGQEVVWARRICPTRARVLSVPFAPARRFGEVVLHDGAPNGERQVSWGTVPVFDEIALFTPSDIATLSAMIVASTPEDVSALSDAFHRNELGLEVVSSGVPLCTCCSEGTVRQEESRAAGRQAVLLGAPEDRSRELLDDWRSAAPDDRAWFNLHRAQ
jgi:hypothetical protein